MLSISSAFEPGARQSGGAAEHEGCVSGRDIFRGGGCVMNKKWKMLAHACVVLCLGIVYLEFVSRSGYGIPCLFHQCTGLECPGCGMTRAMIALLHFDLKAAWRMNALSVTLLPLLLLYLLFRKLKQRRTDELQFSVAELLFLLILLIGTLAYGVLRNLS